jgi:type IV pilus assembly protein PilA
MIVVAIIGILAAIAIPQYQDYTVRSRVTEGLNLASMVKTAVAETAQSTGAMPTSNASAGVADTLSSKYVTSVVVGTSGVITVTYNATTTGITPATSNLIAFTPTMSGGAVDWDCSGPSANGVPSKFRPANCRP